MRYCPTCQAHFEGDEIYCLHDGTRLQSETTYRPGRLAGTSLGGQVNLEVFLFADHLGERYRGRLLSDNREVRITVFHRRFDQDRVDAVRQQLKALGPGLPEQILETYHLEDDSSPRFLVEEQAERESLAHLLKKKGSLDWRQALHLTIQVARILEWLAQEEIPHRAIHPRSIFVDNPQSSTIQVGELAVGLLSFPLPPLEEDTPANAIPIYPGFIAPEWCEPDGEPNLEQTAVFTMGAVLLESLGAPLVDEDTFKEKSLKDWLSMKERDRVSLELPDDAPAALEELANMLIAPDPARRFQAPQAAMRALSGLLGLDPDEIAPPLTRVEAQASPDRPHTQPMANPAADDRSAHEDDEIPQVGTTQIGMPAVQVEAEDSVVEPLEEDEQQEDAVFDGKKTLLMGAITAEDIATHAADQAKDEDEDEQSSSRMITGESSSDIAADKEEASPADEDEPSIVIDDGPVVADGPSKEEEIEEGKPEPSIIVTMEEEPSEEKEPSVIIDDVSATEVGGSKEDEEQKEETPKSRKRKKGKRKKDAPKQKAGTEELIRGENSEEEKTDLEEQDDEHAKPSPSKPKEMEIGFVQARQTQEADDFSDDWFSQSTEDAWEASLVREAYERSIWNERAIRIGLIAALVLVGLGVVFFTMSYEPEEEVAEQKEATGWTRQTAEVDVDALQARFDEAIAEQRLTQPRDSSALTALRELRRHADKDVYDEARELFVASADQLSRTYERLGDLQMAHILSGYASEYDAEDKELRARAEQMRDAYFAARDKANAPGDDDEPQGDEDDEDQAKDGVALASNNGIPRAGSASGSGEEELLQQAQAAYDASDFDRAEELYQQLLADAPDNVEANSQLAQIYFDRADHAQALGYQKTAVNHAPRDINHRLQLGMIHFRLTQYEAAIKAWEEVLVIEPGNRSAERFIGLAQRSMNNRN